MTRKRYTKLLMSHGVSRNRANDLAQHTRNKGCYAGGYDMWKLVNSIGGPLGTIRDVANKLTKSVGRVAIAIGIDTNGFIVQQPDPFEGKCHRCGGTGEEEVGNPAFFGICPRCLGTGMEPTYP